MSINHKTQRMSLTGTFRTWLSVALALAGATIAVSAANVPTTGKAEPTPFEEAILGEEVAWLKMAGWDQYHKYPGSYRRLQDPAPMRPPSLLPLPQILTAPTIDGTPDETAWAQASCGLIQIAIPVSFAEGPLLNLRLLAYRTGDALAIACTASRPVFAPGMVLVDCETAKNHVRIAATADGFQQIPFTSEIWGRNRRTFGKPGKALAAIAADGRSFEALVPLTAFPEGIAKGVVCVPGLEDLFRPVRPVIPYNSHSQSMKWAVLAAFKQVEFRPAAFALRAAGPDAAGRLQVEIRNPGAEALTLKPKAGDPVTVAAGGSQMLTGGEASPVGLAWALELSQDKNKWRLDQLVYDPLPAARAAFERLIEQRAALGRDVTAARAALAAAGGGREGLLNLRRAQRALFFAEPALDPLAEVLFVTRHPLHPSHNYTEFSDAQATPGGAVQVLRLPRRDGRLDPDAGTVTTLFDAGEGFVRDPVTDFDARTIYFSHMPAVPGKGQKTRTKDGWFRILAMDLNGGNVRQLTDGLANDTWPTPLPDGGLAMISSRCHSRFLCFKPSVSVLFRMDADGGNIKQLSFSNLTEWSPSLMRDGRILWTHSEYQDKGANFGHTTWSILPDGTRPELRFGNNTRGGYGNVRQVPDSDELVCTVINHFGDLNGPIALIQPNQGLYNEKAVLSITPDVEAAFNTDYPPMFEAFREPYPLSRDYFLCSHAPRGRFCLYVIDRFGNREILHRDAVYGCMTPTPVAPRPRPPVLAMPAEPKLAAADQGAFMVADVYQGLEGQVARGEAKWLAVFEEVRPELPRLADGSHVRFIDEISATSAYSDNPKLDGGSGEFMNWYATPVHKVDNGKFAKTWPAYVAKTLHGLTPVQPDGSASFIAPAGRTLYFSLLDDRYRELQRMRSVVHLQPGEQRSCIGCHEDRLMAGPAQRMSASIAAPQPLVAPPWGVEPLSFPEHIQPILDRSCISCHDGNKTKPDLRGTVDNNLVPASYRALVVGDKPPVNYADTRFPIVHTKMAPKTLGAVVSPLIQSLEKGHHDVKLSPDEDLALKTWIAMNCPLWGDYARLARHVESKKGEAANKSPTASADANQFGQE